MPHAFTSLFRARLTAMALACAAVALACAKPAPMPTTSAEAVHPQPTPNVVAAGVSDAQARELWASAQQVITSRCVVCHGCYDAPCQLKLGSGEGIRRGATSALVYDPARITAAQPTRLNIDAQDTPQWRALGFHAVVPETPSDDARASLMLRMLNLKREHPTPSDIDQAFTFAIDREQSCNSADNFDDYATAHPEWGMPYALPALTDLEHTQIVEWIMAGAPVFEDAAPPSAMQATIERWETFLNGSSLKAQLMARYLYEHLFIASLVFDEIDEASTFRLVRSRTSTGLPVDEIATRRPFDDPGRAPFYYRFVRVMEPRLAKTHMPYALNARRLALYQQLFMDVEYEITALPSYAPEVASNPLLAFVTIPVRSRYRFLLDEAQNTLMSFIKGPVCRGQVALNVIQERFWVTFVDPDSDWTSQSTSLLAGTAPDLELPAEAGSETLALKWYELAKQHDAYVKRKNDFLKRVAAQDPGLSVDVIWDGDGDNRNAALTVLRHFDSASVVQGLVGGEPKTTWLIDYPMLERIHYLLVAGFDVFGNVGHQIATRMYMDFLRMEGEHNFLVLLPIKRRAALVDAWYRGLDRGAMRSVEYALATFPKEPSIRYRTSTPEHELLAAIQQHLASVINRRHDVEQVEQGELREAMQRLSALPGSAATFWPELSFVSVVQRDGALAHFTVLRDSAHTNITELFREDDRRVPSEDRLTVLRGFVGAYPNALFKVRVDALATFVEGAAHVDSAEAAALFHRHFGVLRTSPSFWQHSDDLHAAYRRLVPQEAGLFDYSRLIGR